MEIRIAELSDSETIAKFQLAMAGETEFKDLDPGIVLKGVQALISDTNKGFYTVAVSGNSLIASLMVTGEWSDWRNQTYWWIQSVYVEPEFRRQGVFTRLFKFTEQLAVEKGNVFSIRLYVEQENEAARNTYKSLGMRFSGYAVLEKEL